MVSLPLRPKQQANDDCQCGAQGTVLNPGPTKDTRAPQAVPEEEMRAVVRGVFPPMRRGCSGDGKCGGGKQGTKAELRKSQPPLSPRSRVRSVRGDVNC